MINKVILLGRVGSDPEVKISTREEKFAGFSLATSERFKNKSGEWQEKTQWHRVVCWDPNIAKTIETYVKKGTTLYIEGQIETRQYDLNGETKYTTEIIIPRFKGILKMIGGKDGSSSKVQSQTNARTEDPAEDIPF
jgi:single-strand DNA-binding protein|tara:strand:+ start:3934 stop:4344 length:411 start_codon:yes stop_codon:yes gene_type:complete